MSSNAEKGDNAAANKAVPSEKPQPEKPVKKPVETRKTAADTAQKKAATKPTGNSAAKATSTTDGKAAPKPAKSEQKDDFAGIKIGKTTYGRTAVVAALVLIGVLATPLGVAAKWMFESISNEDKYVSLVSGLSSDPDVQKAIANETSERVLSIVDVGSLSQKDNTGLLGKLNDLVGKVTGTDLDGQVEKIVRPALETAVDKVVTSNKFQDMWSGANRQAHSALMATIENDTTDVAGLASNGDITLDVSSLLGQATTESKDLGFLAKQLVNKHVQIPLLEKAQVDKIKSFYGVASNVSLWAPIVGIAALIAALVLAKKKWVVGLLIGATFVVAAFVLPIFGSVVNIIQPPELSGKGLTALVGGHIFDEAVANSDMSFGYFVPVGAGIIVLTLVLMFVLPKLRKVS